MSANCEILFGLWNCKFKSKCTSLDKRDQSIDINDLIKATKEVSMKNTIIPLMQIKMVLAILYQNQ